MYQSFINKNFRKATLELISTADNIIREYMDQGYTLTLRQLYYQFVARDIIPNTERWYKRLGSAINDGRLAGLLNWDAIEDRTRNVKRNLHLTSPADGIEVIRDQYGIDMWSNQEQRVEIWIEKNALVGIIADVCSELDVPYFACIGYVSQSEQYAAYRRHSAHQPTIVIHLGDHDPSGIDMTRDIQDRFNMFHGNDHTTVERIALNMDQINEYNPPPNPAKMTDSRFQSYRDEYGTSSWELDALEPAVLSDLVRTWIDKYRDPDLWNERQQQLTADLETFDDIIENLS